MNSPYDERQAQLRDRHARISMWVTFAAGVVAIIINDLAAWGTPVAQISIILLVGYLVFAVPAILSGVMYKSSRDRLYYIIVYIAVALFSLTMCLSEGVRTVFRNGELLDEVLWVALIIASAISLVCAIINLLRRN